MLAPTKLDIYDETSGQSPAMLDATKSDIFDDMSEEFLLCKRQQHWIFVKKHLDNLQTF